MTHVIHFFCPGMPSPDVRARYEQALRPVRGEIVWHTPGGLSSAFVRLAAGWRDQRDRGRCIPTLAKKHEPTDVTTRSLVAFSAGYGAIRELLRVEADREAVDAVALLDALHAGWEPDGTPSDLALEPFVQYATRAREQGSDALLWSWHTDVPVASFPQGYASTTASNRELVRLVGGEGGSFLVGYKNLYPASQPKREHAAALVEWGPGVIGEALVPHLGALALRRADVVHDGTGNKAWLDPTLTLGERVVLWSQAQVSLGSLETSGKNAGPTIAEYFGGATRDGVPAKQMPRSGDWCAAGLCFAERQVLFYGERAPTPWRISGIEIERDAKAAQTWRPIELWRTGAWTPAVGDIAVYVRPPGSNPRTEWRRHVCRVAELGAAGAFTCIDANRGTSWGESQRHRDDVRLGARDLLGFVEMPRVEPAEQRLPAESWAHAVQVSNDVVEGRFGLDYALRGLLPQDLVA